MNALIARASHEHVFTGFAILAAILCIGAGILIGREQGAITTTRTIHVQRTWGTPTSSVDGTQVNPQLTGFTCDVYQTRQTIVCHRP